MGDYGFVTQESEGRTVVALSGEVDVYGSPQLREQLREVVEQSPWDEIALDLRNLSFIDSTGLGVLVGTLKRLREEDRTMVLEAPSPAVYKVFEITGLNQVFTIST